MADDLITYAYPDQPRLTDWHGLTGKRCPARNGPWWCARRPGHIGRHEAGNGFGKVLAAWPQGGGAR